MRRLAKVLTGVAFLLAVTAPLTGWAPLVEAWLFPPAD